CVGQKEQPRLESDRPGIGHALGDVVAGVLEQRDPSGVRARRGPIDRGGRAPVGKLMGPPLVVEGAEGSEGPLRTGPGGTRERGGRGGRGVAALSVRCIRSWAPFCCGWPGRIRWCCIPRLIHQTLSWDRPWMPVVANGTPLSVRMARGSPYSRKRRSKTGRTPTPWVDRRP